MLSKQSRRKQSGFTIFELIVVMTVVAVLMGIVAPRFRLASSTTLQMAGIQMAQDIDVSRTRALSTRQMVRVAFDESDNRYGGYLDHDNDGSIAQSAAEWQALRGFGERSLPAGIIFGRGSAPALPNGQGGAGTGAVTFYSDRVEFDSRGLALPAGASGAVYLMSPAEPNRVVAISVAPSGNTRFWTWTPDEGWK